MTYREYLSYIDYISENGKEQTLSDYGYPADCPWDPDTLTLVFDEIEAAQKNDLAALLHAHGIKLSNFCRMFDIPRSTANQWINTDRTAPPYILQMAAFILISELPTLSEE